MVQIVEYLDSSGTSPFAAWFDRLDSHAARDGDVLIILLGGGTKKRQQRDIATAQVRWDDYRRRKREER